MSDCPHRQVKLIDFQRLPEGAGVDFNAICHDCGQWWGGDYTYNAARVALPSQVLQVLPDAELFPRPAN